MPTLRRYRLRALMRIFSAHSAQWCLVTFGRPHWRQLASLSCFFCHRSWRDPEEAGMEGAGATGAAAAAGSSEDTTSMLAARASGGVVGSVGGNIWNYDLGFTIYEVTENSTRQRPPVSSKAPVSCPLGTAFRAAAMAALFASLVELALPVAAGGEVRAR